MAKIKKINKFQLKHDTEKADFVDQLRQIEWKYWVNRPYTVFMKTAFWRGLTAEYFERNGYPGLEPNCTLYHNPDLYYDQKFTDKSLAYFAEYFKTHKMADVTAQLEKIHRQNLESLASITANQNLSIPERVTHFSELACNYAPACWLNIPLEQHFTKRVEAEVPKYISNEIDKFVN